MTQAPDPEELRRAAPRAVDWLYREHARTVLNWVIRLGGPGLDAPDVAHDVFAVAIARLPTLRPGAPVAPWLFGVTRRVVANARRRARLRRFLGLDQAPEPRAPGPAPDEEADRRWRRWRVQVALDRLGALQREALVLVDLEERGAIEAAEMLGVPVGTVYRRVHEARRAIGADLLRDHTPEELSRWLAPEAP